MVTYDSNMLVIEPEQNEKIIVVSNTKNGALTFLKQKLFQQKIISPIKNIHVKNLRVFNLCKDYNYQSKGYYVSL